ncbi:Kae1-associated kinase Bud32 [Batrachochytrium salamandrivorans]|nr:Kae1-associated kinase Bud32 [Batrachochytrium salamandrivorans]
MEAEWELLAQGAEAKVYLARDPDSCPAIIKDRLPKPYRHPELDKKLSKKRFRGEVKAMQKASEGAGGRFKVPRVDAVDYSKQRIRMEYVEGQTTKQFFDSGAEGREKVAGLIGKAVGALHDLGIVHGDLTTSNLMMANEGGQDVLTVIDFGLAYFTKSVDDFAVDLYVLERAFLSTHPNSEALFAVVLDSYASHCAVGDKVRAQLIEVQQRGRKKLAFG